MFTEFVKDVFHQDSSAGAAIPRSENAYNSSFFGSTIAASAGLVDGKSNLDSDRIMKDVKESLLRELPLVFQSIIKLWELPQASSDNTSATLSRSSSTSAIVEKWGGEGEVHNKYSLQDQILHILEPLLQHHPVNFMDSLLSFWIDSTPTSQIPLQLTMQPPQVRIHYLAF
jgi:hypothetical protein